MSRNQIATQTRISSRVAINNAESIEANEDLIIDCPLNVGKIDTRDNTLLIGKNCTVNGELHGETVIIQGIVRGNVFAQSWIKLEPNSNVVGDLTALKFEIHPDSRFEGRLIYRT